MKASPVLPFDLMASSRAVDALKALADENRLHIVSMLSQRELCAVQLLEQLNISQPTLSHHMKILTLASIVKTRKQGVQVFYTINSQKLDELSALIAAFVKNGAPVRG